MNSSSRFRRLFPVIVFNLNLRRKFTTSTSTPHNFPTESFSLSGSASATAVSKEKEFKRSHLIGELDKNEKIIYKNVILCGWISAIRNVSKNLFFLLLRDHTGIIQLTLTRTHIPEDIFLSMREAVELGNISLESVIAVQGIIQTRPISMNNDFMPTNGSIEVFVQDFKILNRVTEKLPFTLNEKLIPAEETRMKFRYLDLRRPDMQQTIRFRAKINQIIRSFFDSNNFVEVETPILFKSTPEGAREFLVPRPGNLNYALPQSPQQFKQLLMIGGFDKYYQIARCFRDEGMRSDRQPEFTQLDMEMAFVSQQDVMDVMEAAVRKLWNETSEQQLASERFLKITYDEAMSWYGSDKPDLRFQGKIAFSFPQNSSRCVIEGLLLKGRGRQSTNTSNTFEYCLPIEGLKSKNILKAFESAAKVIPGTQWAWHGNKLENCNLISEEELSLIKNRLEVELGLNVGPRDCILLSCRDLDANGGCTALGRARLAALDELTDELSTEPQFLWIHSFPLLTPTSAESRLENPHRRFDSMHHPFTAPDPSTPEDYLFTCENPLALRAQHYDLVLNGQEIGGGSIRIHNSALQERLMRELLGLSPLQINHFDHLLKALRFGAPPHGGMALGLDRLVAILAGKKSIREVIAFPKNSSGQDLCFGAPN